MHHQQGKEPHQQGKEHHRIYGIDACTYTYPNDDDDDSHNVLAVFLSFFFFCTVQDQIFGYGYEQEFFVNFFLELDTYLIRTTVSAPFVVLRTLTF